MKKILVGIGIVLGVVILAVVALVLFGQIKLNSARNFVHDFPKTHVTSDSADIILGERIVTVRNGCIHCHDADMGGMLFINDPMMGQIGGGNLTPTLLSDWTDDEIATAIRSGINREGKPLVFMPSHEFQYLSTGDIAAVVAYLRTLPPLDRPNPEISIGMMGKILYGLGQFPTLVPAASLVKTDLPEIEKPEEAATMEFGKYLVNTSCTGCHREKLEGGPITGAPPTWPPASGLSNMQARAYTEAGFINALRLGVRPDGTNLKEPMIGSTARLMTDVELVAMWRYIETVK